MMIGGILWNNRDAGHYETVDFVKLVETIKNQLPGLEDQISHVGSGMNQGIEIHGESIAEIQGIAERIMADTIFPKGFDGP